MKKAIQFLVKSALFLAALYAVLWLAEALADLAIAVFPW